MKRSKMMLFILCAAVSLGILAGCSLSAASVSSDACTEPDDSGNGDSASSAPVEEAPVPSSDSRAEDTQAAALLRGMTLREKVGQLFIIRPDALDFTLTQDVIDDPHASGSTAVTDAMQTALQEYPAGGVIQFGKNLVSPEQITAFNQSLQQSSSIPLFLCIDEEGSTVSRLANHPAFALPKFESAAAVGASGSPEDTRHMGDVIGAYLHTYGFNTDFAPVADVNTNPANPVIGTRAFSSEAETAGRLARGMADGLAQNGILPVFKHFPGHGDTREDSHAEIAVTNKSAAEMAACEWIPFRQAQIREAVMVGHIAAPQITGDLTPATLSGEIVTGILKNQLGFQGLVITDSLSMKAITDTFSPAEAAVAALQAGCDLLLMPGDYRQAFDGVLAAVKDGTIPEQELNRIVLRILACKEAHGIL